MAINLDDIINKVRKLLALAASSNEHEAALAAQKAQALMQQYNLEMSQVQQKEELYTEEDFTLDSRLIWRKKLLDAVCRANFCSLIMYRGTKYTSIIGQPVNISASKVLYEYLETTLERLAEERYAIHADSAPNWRELHRRTTPAYKRTWKNSFYDGAVAELAYRLYEQRNAFEAQGNDCKALVIVKDAGLKEAEQRLHPKLNTIKFNWQNDNPGFTEGVNAGRNISLNEQISAGK